MRQYDLSSLGMLPGSQGVQIGEPTCATLPIGHVSSHASAASPLALPAGHTVQVMLPMSANLPAKHLVQEDCPGMATQPAVQGVHEADAAAANEPAGQISHFACSASGAKPASHVPQLTERSPTPATPVAGHDTHSVASASAYSPAEHATQRLCSALATWPERSRQSSHAAAPFADALPAPQGAHDEEEDGE